MVAFAFHTPPPLTVDPVLRWLKPLTIVVSTLALAGTLLPLLLFVATFSVFLLPFVIPFWLADAQHELLEAGAEEPAVHLHWVGRSPHPELV